MTPPSENVGRMGVTITLGPEDPYLRMAHGLVPIVGAISPCRFNPPADPAKGIEARRWLTYPDRRKQSPNSWERVPIEQDAPDFARLVQDLFTMADTVRLADKEIRVRAEDGYLVAEIVPARMVKP